MKRGGCGGARGREVGEAQEWRGESEAGEEGNATRNMSRNMDGSADIEVDAVG